jgi:hypothetical protein
MKRVSAIGIIAALAVFALSSAMAAPRDTCWCSKNGEVSKTTQSDCDAIGGTPYKTKEQAVANRFVGLSNPDDFHAISAAAAKKFDTKDGYQYVTKFEDWISDAATHTLDMCESSPRTNLHCDIVFLIGANGRIRKIAFAPNNAFEQCVTKNFRTAATAPKPPGDAWPMHIRIIDGGVPRYKGGDPPFVMFSNAKPYRTH